jgi:transposase
MLRRVWPAAAPIALSYEDRRTLDTWLRAPSTPQSVAQRAAIVVQAGEGRSNNEIARALSTSRPTVILWRERFARDGLAGLTELAVGRGRKPTISADEIITVTLTSKPEGATQWSCRTLADHLGISADTVHRVWRRARIQPHRVRTFKRSSDPEFLKKLRDVVGLYLNPPDRAIVLCVDEKSQIQGLDRTQPGLPLKPGKAGTMTHDYKRHGTTTLFPALQILTGKVVGECMPRHRHQEFLRFLRRLDQEFPKRLALHLMLDNYGSHTHPKVKDWLAAHRRFHLHFTPTGALWLNMVESWFSQLTRRRIRRGTFVSVPDLIAAIAEYIDTHNNDPVPFVWTATVNSIEEKLRDCQDISRTVH